MVSLVAMALGIVLGWTVLGWVVIQVANQVVVQNPLW
mgnify:CR=1 FL=1